MADDHHTIMLQAVTIPGEEISLVAEKMLVEAHHLQRILHGLATIPDQSTQAKELSASLDKASAVLAKAIGVFHDELSAIYRALDGSS